MKRFLGTLGTMLMLSGLPLVAQNGVIQGTVRDEVGRPLHGAKVHAELHGVAMGKAIRYVETDESGAFTIDRLEYGYYDVSGMKVQEYYPDTGNSFYADRPLANVSISPEHLAATITLKLGPKAGVMSGTVKDAVTGKPIPPAFMLRQRTSSNRWMSASVPSQFRVLIPAETDVSVEVRSAGYKTFSSAVRLDPGTEMPFDIKLEPTFDRSLTPIRFLIPKRFVGWLRLECNDKSAPPSAMEGNARVFRFESDSVLATSSPCPQDGAAQEYLYYAQDGAVTSVPSDYWHHKGFIWGEYFGFRGGERRMYGFFVGTEEEFRKKPNAPMN